MTQRRLAGWPQRLPLVSPEDREEVLRSWAPHCGGAVPRERCLPFAAVRDLSPQDFVQLLARDLRASGLVVGENYRFGYRVRLPCSLKSHSCWCTTWSSLWRAGIMSTQRITRQPEGLFARNNM